ncbi:MAG: phosphotransferase family protein [bacterium]|nr:phosphotransferase family protein [bacterium]MCP5070460.1 phosphotransferase family protein [bacterium]
MNATPELKTGLERALGERWQTPVTVEEVGVASTGARRRNVLFDATRNGKTLPLVATIIPNPAMQVMSISVEAANLRLAFERGMPVPELHGAWEDPCFVGGPFFVTSRIEGETIPRQVLRLVEADPSLGPRLARQCGEALARLHTADPARAHPDLAGPKPDANPIDQGIATLESLRQELLQPSPSFALGLRWLERHAPAPPAALSLVHGDFRNGNLIVGPDGLRATLDWELAHIGDPMRDPAWLCQRMWRFRNDLLEVGGFGSLDELREGYEAAGGTWREDAFHWWKVQGTLGWGLGLASQAKAHIDGLVPSIVMAASGRRVAELEYDLLRLIQRDYS